MAIIKCKMCGGDLVLNPGQSVAECEYCGSLQTVPAADNEKKLTLFARANRLRSACEFDKAAGIYETIVADFPEEAESYWGLVLCKYGIEYVDDPGTGKKIPTCHRSSFESVLDDSNLEQALENADVVARKVYREEARQIEELRKGIIAVSSREEPYDIFICYKETDSSGNRTLDSVLAQDIYDALTEKGYRVFFSRITLEDKLGQEYEPYIFAALNSAKIMLAVGTDYEFYNAVWVKNEWSRFLKLMTQDKTKHLIPCYKGIDAYDMPKEFAKLQAQDLGKLGAMQDLLRGIQKLMPRQKKETIQETVQKPANSPTAPLLRRMFLFLEEGNWTEADKYAERVLDMDPECGEAYLGKLMAERQIKTKGALGEGTTPLGTSANYKNAVRFADVGLKKHLEGAEQKISKQIELSRKESAYRNAVMLLRNANTEQELRNAALEFERLSGYRDALQQKEKCLQKIVDLNNTDIYAEACARVGEIRSSEKPLATRIQAGEKAVELLETILQFKNSQSMYLECQDLLEELRAQEQANKEAAEKERIYQAGEAILRSTRMITDYLGAAREFEKILDYKDAREKRDRCLKAHEMHILSSVTACISKAEDTRQTAQERLKAANNARKRLDEEGKYLSNESELREKTEDLLTQLQELERKEEEERYQAMLNTARESDDLESMREASAYFEAKGDYWDSKSLAKHCAVRIADLERQAEEARIAEELRQKELRKQEQKEEEERIRKKMITIIAVILTVIVLFVALIVSTAVSKQKKAFQEALALYEAGEFAQAAEQFKELGTEEANRYYEDALRALDEQREEEERMAQQAAAEAAAAVAAEAAALEESGDIIGAAMRYGTLTEYPEYMEKSFELWNQFARRKTIIAGNTATMVIRNDGTVSATGYNDAHELDVQNWKNVVALTYGLDFSVGLKEDGTILLSGKMTGNILNALEWNGIVDIAAGHKFIAGLKADGTVVTTEPDSFFDVSDWTDIVDITMGVGEASVYGIRKDGTVVTVKANMAEVCDVSSWKDIVAVEAVHDGVMGLKADGTIVQAGLDKRSGCLNWKNMSAIRVNAWSVGVRSDGTVAVLIPDGADIVAKTDVSGAGRWSNIVDVAVGSNHIVGLRSDGTLVALGANKHGQINVTGEQWTDIRLP